MSCLSAAVIGTLGAVGMARVRYRSKGMMEYLSTVPIMIPEIILGMVFLVFFQCWNCLWYDNAGDCAYYLLYSLYFHDGKGTSGRLDKSLEEAARDWEQDRCGHFLTLPYR